MKKILVFAITMVALFCMGCGDDAAEGPTNISITIIDTTVVECHHPHHGHCKK